MATFLRLSFVTFILAFIFCCLEPSMVLCKVDLSAPVYQQKSNKVTRVGENWAEIRTKRDVERGHKLSKRQVNGYTIPDAALQQHIVDSHNKLRRQEGASNMEYMTWNADLAEMGGLWAEMCVWEHGQPEYDNRPYSQIGQNLYISSSSRDHKGHIDGAMEGWYDREKPHYDFDTQTCTPGEQCGHYTQVVWSSSREVGCGIAFCETTVGISWSDGTYVVCNYGPPGNYQGQDPYIKGSPCTECGSGQNWCDDGLCRDRDECPHCECKAACENCATVTDSCSCSCAKGFTGSRCTDNCQDYHENCGANPGWPTFWCTDNRPYVLNNCPLLCGLCEPADGTPVTCEETTTTTTTPKPTTTTTTTTPQTTTTTTTPQTTTTTTTTPQTTTTTITTPQTTTTSTTTTPQTTTTRITTTQVDCTGYCKNDGVSSVVNNECRCKCEGDYQGETCEESREEASVGVIVTLWAAINRWEPVWVSFIRPFLVYVVNNWCNDHVTQCCPGATIDRTTSYQSFTTESEVVIGEGYPQEFLQYGRRTTRALVFVFGAPNNDLCSNSINSVNRKKRDLPDMTLPQETLMDIMKSVERNLTETLLDCCNITLVSIEEAEVETEEETTTMKDEDNKGPLGLDLWIWVVIGIGGCTIVLATCCIVICCCCIRKSNANSRSKKYEATTNAPVNGYENNGYSGKRY